MRDGTKLNVKVFALTWWVIAFDGASSSVTVQ